MKAQVFLALPGGAESASRQYRYSVALCGLRERRPIAMREAHPQGLAALHARHVPGGQAAGELGAEEWTDKCLLATELLNYLPRAMRECTR